ncbi:MAG: acyl-ACP--UDP-N-acetylglucosamine O-acyltransferase [Verrucomicrobiota bacterium]
MIHPTAVIHPGARLDASVEVKPHAVIDEHVSLGANCVVGPHTHLTGHTAIGAGNIFHSGCVIGDAPQDLKYKGEPTRLVIGDLNIFREHVTVHRSAKMGEETVIGSKNFLMAGSHVGHNCRLGNEIIIANGAMLGGHVIVEDRVFISGTCMVHQFVRIGTLALMQGGSGVSKDIPPFTITTGNNRICGLNIIGMRRAGFSSEQRLELKKLYHALFRSGKNFRAALSDAELNFTSDVAQTMLKFVSASKRGVCAEVSQSENDAAID